MTLRSHDGAPLSPAAYKRQVLAEVESALDRRLAAYARADGRSPALVAAFERLEPLALAQQMTSVIPVVDDTHPLAERVGPCFDTNGVRAVLGRHRGRPVSKQAVEARRARGSVLALATADERWVYPTWQFGPDGDVRADAVSVLGAFERGLSGHGGVRRFAWTIASWFATPAAALDGRTPVEWLDAEPDAEPVRSLATVAAARWAA